MPAQAERDAFFVIPAEKLADCEDAARLIASALAAHGAVEIPRMDAPICLERPIALDSGMKLRVHPETVMRVKPGRCGCMVRNAHLL
ncbi:MAG: hypothetical protein IJ048_02765, partial [Clostridia bacterium]|nr:hypothetical protein [Clostridia bacterium]